MADRLIIFEDGGYPNFYPLTLSRPTFELRCGVWALWERLARSFPGYQLLFACREELAPTVRIRTGLTVNQIDYLPGDRLVFVNGRLRLDDKLADELRTSTANRVFRHGQVTAACVMAESLKSAPSDTIRFVGEGAALALGDMADVVDGEFEFFSYLWDLINRNRDQIGLDYQSIHQVGEIDRMPGRARIDSSARIILKDNLYIAPDAEIGPGAVIDNRHGPVVIDSRAVIGPLSYIQGPCAIGAGTQILRGNIREGCSFGPCCRVGGEVEESIFQGYTNKYHDGFMGHAYLGSWVNLGAMTTNSDLKNNYRNIAVSVKGRMVDTGSTKVGTFIGDHSKTGIGTLLNTGVSIGFSCNIFGGTLVTSREVPSFSWGDERGYEVYKPEKALEVARTVMARRGVELTDHDEWLFASIFEQTAAER